MSYDGHGRLSTRKTPIEEAVMHEYFTALFGVITTLCISSLLPLLSLAVKTTPQTAASGERIIKLNVLVTDSSGHPVLDVAKDEFRILEDGAPQAISYFSKDELPLDYCIAVDTSASVRDSIDQVIDAAQEIVRNSKPGDETALIEVKSMSDLMQEFTSNKSTVLRALDRLRGRASQGSAIIDGVYLASEYVSKYNPIDHLSRRAVIVISDGLENDSYYKLDQLRKLLRQQNVQIFAIGYDMNRAAKLKDIYGQERGARAPIKLLTEIAKETGGLAYFPHSNAELQEAASRVLQTLRLQFVIGYKPPEINTKNPYHTLTVSIADSPGRERRTAITRAGYLDQTKK
jgi:Ca-activated chloride channel homolog